MIYSVLWIVAIAVIFWLLIIRPAQRRQKEIAHVQASIAVGEDVVLTSGIFGTVREADEATLHVEIAPGVVIKVARGAVGSVIREDVADDAVSDGTTDEISGEPGGSTDADNEER